MTQCCFDLKVRLLLSIKGQTFISARSAEGCGEEFIPSLCQWSWCRFSIAGSNCKSTCYRSLLHSSSQTLPWNGRLTSPVQVPFPHLFLFWNSIAVKQVEKPLLGAHTEASEKALCSFTIPHPNEVQSRPWSCGNEDCQCPKSLACSQEICKP